MGMLDFITDIPIVGDALGAVAGHASAKNLQNDAQAHDAAMFGHQAQHDKDMFGLESDFNAKQAKLSYDRERQFTKDMPGLQMQGLKSAGLNPILAATGGFKADSGGRQQATAKAQSSAKGSGGGVPPGSRLMIGETAKRYAEVGLLKEQQNLTRAQKSKVDKETQYVGTKTDIAEPVSQLMQAIAGLLEQSNIDRNTSRRIWEWLTEELPDVTKPLTKKEQVEMLDKAKRRFPQLKGVDNAKRNIFGVN